MGAEEVLAFGAVRQDDVGIEGKLLVEGEDLGEFGTDAVGQPVGNGLLHHRLDDHIVFGALQLGHVDGAVAAGNAPILAIALVPQADELGAEIRLEDTRQDQHRRHGGVEPHVRTGVGAHGIGQGPDGFGGCREHTRVEGAGDALVGIEDDRTLA